MAGLKSTTASGFWMKDIQANEFLSIAIEAAKEAGDILLKNLGQVRPDEIDSKRLFDFVTHVDLESEEAIIRHINTAYPSHAIWAEETGQKNKASDYLWIIDPLDGTTNYIHGFPCFSISIALKYKNKLILGVIFDPIRNELFYAQKDEGAFLNDKRIQVSDIEDLSKALVATGFPFREKDQLDVYLKSFFSIFKQCSGVRRAGSAALDLAYIGCGRVDGFWEIGLSSWDIAAGVLIVEEAGGVITDFKGRNEYYVTGNIVAGNPHIHRELVSITKQIFKK